MVVNKIRSRVDHIVAVETFPGFSQFIDTAENILVINANIETFRMRKTFDLVTATGIMQFFPENVARDIYRNIYDMVKPGGQLVMRAHVGLHETVRVEKSDELQADYFAEFRHVVLERQILEECGFAVEIIDEVAAELNVWDNTKHLYFIGSK
jgi:cyclopropane fatty-acyl-phospholipid synthase-like methyltransferase